MSLSDEVRGIIRDIPDFPEPGVMFRDISPLLADGKIYYQSQDNGVYVVAAQPTYKLLANNRADDGARSNACPVADGGRLIVRTDGYIHCYAK